MMSETKEFKTIVGTLTVTLEDVPGLTFTAEFSPALHPWGLSGQSSSVVRTCNTMTQAELEFAEFQERHARPRIEYMMLRFEQSGQMELRGRVAMQLDNSRSMGARKYV